MIYLVRIHIKYFILDEKNRKTKVQSDDLSSSDEDTPEKSTKANKDEIWKVTDVYQTSSSDDDDDGNDDHEHSRNRRLRSR